MDFTNRSAQPQSFQPNAQPNGPAAPQASRIKPKETKYSEGDSRWYRWGRAALLVVSVLLLVSVVGLLYTSRPDSQAKYVKSGELQAVFLNSGQVYFGNVRSINSQYFVLSNIYYLQTSGSGSNQSSDNGNVSLVKLGCELHEPYDQMVINSNQVTFWENLQDNGKVAKAVAAFEKQNPDGQKCSEQSAAPTSTNVQGNANASPSTSSNAGTGTSANGTSKP